MKIEELKTTLTENEVPYSQMTWKHSRSDCRVWTMNIDPGKSNIFLVYYVNRSDLEDNGYDILSSQGTYTGLDSDSVLDKVFELIHNNDNKN